MGDVAMDTRENEVRRPWYLLPFTALWHIVTALEKRLGIVRSLLIGLGLMVLGVVFCLTFVGILIGVPTFFLGFFLLLRALY